LVIGEINKQDWRVATASVSARRNSDIQGPWRSVSADQNGSIEQTVPLSVGQRNDGPVGGRCAAR
jgi:hypothetical protein